MRDLTKPHNFSLKNKLQNVNNAVVNQISANEGENSRVNSKIMSLLQIKEI